jgi:hypothetical protein
MRGRLGDMVYLKHFAPVEGGPRFEIKVDESGYFSAYLDDQDSGHRTDSLAKLKAALERSARKAHRVNRKKLDIPIYRFRNGKMVPGTVYAIHAGTHHPMARWTDGSPAGRLDFRETGLFAGSMPEAEQQNFERHAAVARSAKEAMDRITKKYRLDVRSLTYELTRSEGE